MNFSSKKENILANIRNALVTNTPIPFPNSEGTNSVFVPLTQEIDIEFAEQFSALGGKFIFCINEQELAFQLSSLIKKMNWQKIFCVEEKVIASFANSIKDRLIQTDLANADVSITGCKYLIARTGSMVLDAAQEGGRTASVYAPVHICVAYTKQLVYDVQDALNDMKEKFTLQPNTIPSLITFASGPSRTADIEKTLVVGVHGPKEVYCFLVDAL